MLPSRPPDFDHEFRRRFERLFGPVYSFFFNRGIPREEARDLTQETFLRVYQSMSGFRGEASFETWLFQIATNLWRNYVRNQHAEKRAAQEVSLESAVEDGRRLPLDRPLPGVAPRAGALDGILAGEQRAVLRQALDDLPPRMRRCVLLRIDHDLKYREIAALLRVSIETVKSQLSQARDRLEAQVGRYLARPGGELR